MALGPSDFNCTIDLQHVFCFQGDDRNDFLNEDSEPYLLVLMVKVDGTGYQQNANFLVGNVSTFSSVGGQGNLGGSVSNGTNISVPDDVGKWTTELRSIPISVANQQVTAIPGFIACAAVLMEENMTSAKAIAAAFSALRHTVTTTIDDVITNLDLVGVAAEAAFEFATAQAAGKPLATLEEAVVIVLRRRLHPVENLFPSAAIGVGGLALLTNLGIDGILGSAIDRDDVMGWYFHLFAQPELARTVAPSPWAPFGTVITIGATWDNMPDTAYALHGAAYAHHRFTPSGQTLPTSKRIQVTCTSKRQLGSGQRRVSGIGGIENGQRWELSRPRAAGMILRGEKEFFVRGDDGRTVEVLAVKGGSAQGAPWYYLATSTDYERANNLVELPDCPPLPAIETWY